MLTAIGKKQDLESGEDVMIALDAAATEFYDEKPKSIISKIDGRKLSADEMVDFGKKMG